MHMCRYVCVCACTRVHILHGVLCRHECVCAQCGALCVCARTCVYMHMCEEGCFCFRVWREVYVCCVCVCACVCLHTYVWRARLLVSSLSNFMSGA